MLQAVYKSKKELKENIGKPLRYIENSFFGAEYKSTGVFCVADSSPSRKWFAEITMQDDKIVKIK